MGLDYMHRVCKLIHTDIKPENIVFGLTDKVKQDYFYKHVLSTQLSNIHNSEQKVILTKKQAKNVKKRQRKKKKKLEEQVEQSDVTQNEETF